LSDITINENAMDEMSTHALAYSSPRPRDHHGSRHLRFRGPAPPLRLAMSKGWGGRRDRRETKILSGTPGEIRIPLFAAQASTPSRIWNRP